MKHNFYWLLILVAVLFFNGCGDSKLPDYNKVDKIRVLALTTPTPEVNAGATVTLTPVISDITSTAALTDSVQVCLDPGIGFGAVPTCVGNPSVVTVHTNRTLTLPGVVENWTGAADSFAVTVPISAIIFAGRTAREQYNGVNYLVEYTLKNSAGIEIRSLRRIIVSDSAKTAKNANPVITDIFSNGVTMTTLPVGESKVQLSADLTAASNESYSVQNLDGSTTGFTEKSAVTWIITDGETKFYRSEVGGSNEYTGPSSAPTGRSAYILAIARDGRGGVTAVKKKF